MVAKLCDCSVWASLLRSWLCVPTQYDCNGNVQSCVDDAEVKRRREEETALRCHDVKAEITVHSNEEISTTPNALYKVSGKHQ